MGDPLAAGGQRAPPGASPCATGEHYPIVIFLLEVLDMFHFLVGSRQGGLTSSRQRGKQTHKGCQWFNFPLLIEFNLNTNGKCLPLLFCGLVLKGDGQHPALPNRKMWV